MNLFTKILCAIVVLGAALLAWMLHLETKRADYWAGFERTRAARAARHSGGQVLHTGQEEEEEEIETIPLNQKSDD